MAFSTDSVKQEGDKIIAALNADLQTLRVGRANPLIVEGIMVEAYGAKTPLKQVASVTVPDARTLIIQPWDKSIIKDIEKSIVIANIGINPVNEGQQIRMVVPPLTEEGRKELVKSVNEKMEKARISLRQVRDKLREDVVKQERAKEITQDDKFALHKKLDDAVKEYNDRIKDIGDKKEQEIMTI
jgi:ribosome recycling factor